MSSNVLKHGCEYFEIKEIDSRFILINNVQKRELIDVDGLFDRFYLADLSRYQNSTGFGLSIVKLIVEIY